jgi:hypothetical protein
MALINHHGHVGSIFSKAREPSASEKERSSPPTSWMTGTSVRLEESWLHQQQLKDSEGNGLNVFNHGYSWLIMDIQYYSWLKILNVYDIQMI